MSWWAIIASIVGAVGGVVGMVFGGLGIWYSRAANVRAAEAHEIFMRRVRREEDAREVDARKDELMRLAYEGAQAAQSGSTLLEVTVRLESEIDRKAAWELSKEGRATIEGDRCSIPVNKLPEEIQRLLS